MNLALIYLKVCNRNLNQIKIPTLILLKNAFITKIRKVNLKYMYIVKYLYWYDKSESDRKWRVYFITDFSHSDLNMLKLNI